MVKRKKYKRIEDMTAEEWEKRMKEFDDSLTPAEPTEVYADPRYTERHEGATPFGGDYSIAYYYDADNNPCEKDKAKYVNIVIYDKDGKRVNEVYGDLG
jgi:hypothetical protein